MRRRGSADVPSRSLERVKPRLEPEGEGSIVAMDEEWLLARAEEMA